MLTNIRIQHLVAIILLLALLVVNIVLTHQVFTKPFPGHNDFMTPWEATRAFWLDGLNPYGEEATARIQMQIFGRPPLPEEDPGFFSYPLYATYFIVPLADMPYSWASAIWMVLLEACLVLTLFLVLSLFEWKVSPAMMPIIILWWLFFYPSARGLILGQFSHFVFLLEVLTLWAIARQNDNLAGIVLGISTLKPQMGYLLVPFLLLWAWRGHRWRFIQAFIATFLILMASSFVIYPAWFTEWLHRLSVYPSYTLGSPIWLLTQDYLGLGDVGEWTVTLLLYGLVLWSWWMVLVQRKNERLLWAIVWTLTITHIVAPRTASPHFVVFLIPVVFFAQEWQRRYAGRINWRTGVMLFTLFLLPWIQFIATVGGVGNEQEDPSTHLILPVVMLAIMWFSRRMWWENAPRIDVVDNAIPESSPELAQGEA